MQDPNLMHQRQHLYSSSCSPSDRRELNPVVAFVNQRQQQRQQQQRQQQHQEEEEVEPLDGLAQRSGHGIEVTVRYNNNNNKGFENDDK
jgi:hypothetical protein